MVVGDTCALRAVAVDAGDGAGQRHVVLVMLGMRADAHGGLKQSVARPGAEQQRVVRHLGPACRAHTLPTLLHARVQQPPRAGQAQSLTLLVPRQHGVEPRHHEPSRAQRHAVVGGHRRGRVAGAPTGSRGQVMSVELGVYTEGAETSETV